MISVDSYNNISKLKDRQDLMVRPRSAMETGQKSFSNDLVSSYSESFPPRNRSVPYGFDFDLDEVWSPLNPQLRGVYKSHLRNSNSASSNNSLLLGGNRKANMLGTRNDEDKSESKSQDSEEFAVDNDDIFQKINSLGGRMERSKTFDLNSSNVTFSSGLPSARTLRGGQPPVVRGRHSSLDTRPHKNLGSSPISTLAMDNLRSRNGSFGNTYYKKQ